MNNKIVNPFDAVEIDPNLIVTDESAEPLDWSQFAKESHITGTPIKAEELVDMTFDILRCKKFDSEFEGQDHCWFCIVRPVGQDEVFQTTLGGGAVVEVLDMYAAKGGNRPLRVTLGMTKGGKFGKYYSFK